MHILLIGLRGSGKSTLARSLASRLVRPAIDLDDATLRLLGCRSAAEAWDEHGESAFRKAEAAALDETLGLERPHVVALGGGSPTAPGAEKAIIRAREGDAALVIYLRARPQSLRARLKEAGGPGENRPSLTGGDPLAEMEDVFARRDPLYLRLADAVIETDDLNAGQTLDALEAVVRRLGNTGQAAAE